LCVVTTGSRFLRGPWVTVGHPSTLVLPSFLVITPITTSHGNPAVSTSADECCCQHCSHWESFIEHQMKRFMPPGNTQVFTVTQPQIYKWSFSFIGGQEDLN